MALNNLINSPFPLSAVKGGTGVASPTIHGLMVAQGSSAMVSLVLAAGQVAIGTTASDPVGATLTQGAGISITSASGSITIANTAVSGFLTVNQTSATVTMVAGTQYICTSTASAQVTLTLPAAAALGDIFRIIGVAGNTGGWVLQANTGQVVYVGNVACSSAGTWTSGDKTDNMTIVCTVANTGFALIDGVTAGFSST